MHSPTHSKTTLATLWLQFRHLLFLFGRELGQVFQAGYRQVGNNLIPPPLP